MSGEKCVTVSLQEQHRRRIEAAHRRARRVADACAAAGNEAGQARAEVAQIEQAILALGQEAEDYMRQEHARFNDLRHGFERAYGEFENHLQAVRREAEDLAERRGAAEDGNAAAQAEEQAEQVEAALQRIGVASLAALREELRGVADTLAQNLSAERSKALHEQWQQGQRRAALAGLRAELAERLKPGSVSLAWVQAEAEQLWANVNARLERGDRVEQADIGKLQAELARLVEAAAELDRKHRERLFIAEKIQDIFAGAGFLALGGEDVAVQRHADIAQAFISNYERREQQTRVESRIPLTGEIVFDMRGPEGSQSEAMVPARHCDTDLQRIIAAAKALGIDITDISIKNPDGSFDSLALEGEGEDAEARHGAYGSQALRS